jgi:MYXO-CTERM domain-containing protein
MRKLLFVLATVSLLALGAAHKPVAAQERDEAVRTQEVEDADDDGGKVGLIGLAGLLGLAGLMRRDRNRETRVRMDQPR